MIPAVIEDTNRSEYMEALKEYQKEKSLVKLVRLFEKEQIVYREKCNYFL